MLDSFPETTRALAEDGQRRWIAGALGGAALAGAWLVWLLAGEVTVYVPSTRARVEASEPPRPIESTVEGRMVASHMVLGGRVIEGDPLVQLDDEEQRLALEEASAHLRALEAELADYEQLVAEEQALAAGMASVAGKAEEEAAARSEHAEAAASLAERKATGVADLQGGWAISRNEYLDVTTEARKQRAVARAERAARERAVAERSLKNLEGRVRIRELTRSMTVKRGEADETRARISRLAVELSRRAVRAPATGRLADVPSIPPGSVVTVGQRLATLVPDGGLRVVAELAPGSALGRVEAGQTARVRLAAFPWAEFGSLAARVRRTADEPRDGTMRVELDLEPASTPRIPLRHGMVAAVEIAVERATPAALLVRGAGRLVRPRDDAPPPGPAVASEVSHE